MFDTYDISHLLKSDTRNVIAVLVQHYGLSTFSYIRGRGGLLAQLDLRSGNVPVETIATDATWKTSEHLAHDPRGPRLSQQLGFAERYDARAWDPSWTTSEFDDSAWTASRVVGPV